MSLNTIKLDAQQLADLYSEYLVESHSGTTAQIKAESGERKADNEERVAGNLKIRTEEKRAPGFLGHNGKKILVMVSHDSVPYLPDHELNFLTTVLTACKLSMADIAITNLHGMNGDDIKSMINAEGRSILLFGLEPANISLPINFPPFQLQQFDKRNYLHAPTLSDIENDKELKKQLWTSLKKMFGL